jgi:hypothetical protein
VRGRVLARAFVVACAAALAVLGAVSTSDALAPAASSERIGVLETVAPSEIGAALDATISRARVHLPSLPSVRPPVAAAAAAALAVAIGLLAQFGVFGRNAAAFRSRRVERIATRGPPLA